MVFRLQKKGISAYNAGASYTPGNIFVFKGAWRFGGVNIARLAVNGSKSTLNWLCSLTDFECIQPSSGIFSYSIRITACAPKFPAAMSIFCIFQHSHIERRLLTLKRAAIELTQYSVSISGNMVRINFGKRVFRTKNKMSKNTEEKGKRKKTKRKRKDGETEKRGNKKRLRGEIEGRMKKIKTKKGQKKMERRRNRKKRNGKSYPPSWSAHLTQIFRPQKCRNDTGPLFACIFPALKNHNGTPCRFFTFPYDTGR